MVYYDYHKKVMIILGVNNMKKGYESSNIAIFVNSFDGYQDLWDVFWDILDEYWRDCPFSKYLVTNEINYCREGIVTIQTGKEVNWFIRTQKAMDFIKEDYFIMFLEDYYPSKYIKTTDIIDIVNKMQTDNIYFYRLSPRKDFPKNKGCIVVPKGNEYPITLQLAVWKTSYFKRIVNELMEKGCKSPWDFERYLKNNYKYCPPDHNGLLQGIRFDNRDIIGYKNGVLRGKWFPGVRKYYEKRGFDFSKSKRDIMSKKEYLRYKIICLLSNNINEKNKRIIYSLLNKNKNTIYEVLNDEK